MGLNAKEESRRDPVPEGAHHAVCFAIVDLGTQPPMPGSQFGNKRQHKALFMFELPDERISLERDGVLLDLPRSISKDFNVSLHELASLRKFLVAWRGRQFTDEELKGFDLKNVLGANCVLNIVHNEKGYADIQSVMPLMKGTPKRTAENKPLVFDLDAHVGTVLPEQLPPWVRERIERSDEWQERIGANGHSDHAPPPDEGANDPIPF